MFLAQAVPTVYRLASCILYQFFVYQVWATPSVHPQSHSLLHCLAWMPVLQNCWGISPRHEISGEFVRIAFFMPNSRAVGTSKIPPRAQPFAWGADSMRNFLLGALQTIFEIFSQIHQDLPVRIQGFCVLLKKLGFNKLPLFFFERRAIAFVVITFASLLAADSARAMTDALSHAAVGLAALSTREDDILAVVVIAQVSLDAMPNPTLVLTFGHRKQVRDSNFLFLEMEDYGWTLKQVVQDKHGAKFYFIFRLELILLFLQLPNLDEGPLRLVVYQNLWVVIIYLPVELQFQCSNFIHHVSSYQMLQLWLEQRAVLADCFFAQDLEDFGLNMGWILRHVELQSVVNN